MPLIRAFRTSFGTTTTKEVILVRAIGTDGVVGWGECVAAEAPRYSGEWNAGAWIVLRDFLVPAALEGHDAGIRGHPMAYAALEAAFADLDLRRKGVSLSEHLGGASDRVPCGVSVGIENDLDALVDVVASFVDLGYRRVKLKIEPGRDVDVVSAVRDAFPDVPLSVDANAAYRRDTWDALLALDDLELEYLEQPLPEDDLLGHIELQRRLATPICLDDTITSARAARAAIELRACGVINVKVGRVGGLSESLAIHEVATAAGVPLWCGGMLETGIGRAVNVAVASLPGFTLPGDTSGSDRYFERDVTEPFVVEADGTMAVPDGPEIGVEPVPEILEEIEVERTIVRHE
ncbi:MAG TPA: o-succinylbenzoate synthase [Actinomycetota bacterium]|nr:o-succinylbenzoate synthase [Actinomycetota bacterium]